MKPRARSEITLRLLTPAGVRMPSTGPMIRPASR